MIYITATPFKCMHCVIVEPQFSQYVRTMAGILEGHWYNYCGNGGSRKASHLTIGSMVYTRESWGSSYDNILVVPTSMALQRPLNVNQ